jgi:uncharacterized membrane protein YkvA (DUF1232 family)
MLFSLLDEVIVRIEAIDPNRDLAAFVSCLSEARPDLVDELTDRLGQAGSSRVLQALGRQMLLRIAELPDIAQAMREAVERRATHPAARCAMVGALAYLVQPRDLIPDDRPAGFGYVDDCMILRATVSEYFDILPDELSDLDCERQVLQLLAMCANPARLPLFQGAIDGVWHLFQRLLALSADQADQTAEALIAAPLEMNLPIQGFTLPYGSGPDVMHPPSAGAISIEGDEVRVAFQGGGELLLS